MGYWVVVVTRNGSAHLPGTLDSLIDQEEKPTRIIVVDDGSSNGTPDILSKYATNNKEVTILTKPDRGYDIRRVPANINAAWTENMDPDAEYFMISGDDCTYPHHYAHSLLNRMRADKRIVVASGRPSTGLVRSQEHSPSGSGRMVRCSFWRDIGGAYPVKAGWETWLLYAAEERGLRTKLFEDLVYDHQRPRGAGHQFVYWGAAMGNLGYHPLYAIGRIAINALRPSLAPKRAVNMFRGYLQAKLGSTDPFIQEYDQSIRSFVRLKQSQRIGQLITAQL